MSPSSFRSIMVPLDGSPLAEAAIPYAVAIAERARSKVRFVLVHQEQHPPLLIEPPSVYLREQTERFRGRLGGSLTSMILTGAVAPSLVGHAQEIGADLVVMTTHGLGGLHRALVGSVADQLIRTLEIPLMVVRPRPDGSLPPLNLREILVPLDGSLLAEVALKPAVALAHLWNAEISLLQVVPPPVIPVELTLPYGVSQSDELTGSRTEEATDYLHNVAEWLRTTGAKVSRVAVEASAPVQRTLLEAAHSGGIDLIAMATHGRGGVRRFVLGSSTDAMVRSSELPVLVVPHSRAARMVAKVQAKMALQR